MQHHALSLQIVDDGDVVDLTPVNLVEFDGRSRIFWRPTNQVVPDLQVYLAVRVIEAKVAEKNTGARISLWRQGAIEEARKSGKV